MKADLKPQNKDVQNGIFTTKAADVGGRHENETDMSKLHLLKKGRCLTWPVRDVKTRAGV